MSTPEIEHWMELAAMEQARKVWPGAAEQADLGKQWAITDLQELALRLAAIIARHAAPASLERELSDEVRCLKWIGKFITTASDGGDAWCAVRNQPGASKWANKLRAVLRKYDEAKKVS